ncbi:uncharacterized protein ACA1_244830 [Acanthamoeba castellanii str. Neff]|uniref:Uncharacterized protein n=1 Tax=Acanthamoeba castellanii (strain ATCC 30010 / Neff) TaxID=1257118 RepID=L8GL33_ACACF|nr:uncharacterized protein ACA1_244830 [Acanthamoeba castellanii str. Neff]ELR13433.1 hypothetical protein ACA1_244830 [Acanthamoeba castellanii str. Neff]
MKGLLAIVLLGLLAFSMAQDSTTVTVQKQTAPVAVVASQAAQQAVTFYPVITTSSACSIHPFWML